MKIVWLKFVVGINDGIATTKLCTSTDDKQTFSVFVHFHLATVGNRLIY
jgi:hypothetical protein